MSGNVKLPTSRLTNGNISGYGDDFKAKGYSMNREETHCDAV